MIDTIFLPCSDKHPESHAIRDFLTQMETILTRRGFKGRSLMQEAAIGGDQSIFEAVSTTLGEGLPTEQVWYSLFSIDTVTEMTPTYLGLDGWPSKCLNSLISRQGGQSSHSIDVHFPTATKVMLDPILPLQVPSQGLSYQDEKLSTSIISDLES